MLGVSSLFVRGWTGREALVAPIGSGRRYPPSPWGLRHGPGVGESPPALGRRGAPPPPRPLRAAGGAPTRPRRRGGVASPRPTAFPPLVRPGPTGPVAPGAAPSAGRSRRRRRMGPPLGCVTGVLQKEAWDCRV